VHLPFVVVIVAVSLFYADLRTDSATIACCSLHSNISLELTAAHGPNDATRDKLLQHIETKRLQLVRLLVLIKWKSRTSGDKDGDALERLHEMIESLEDKDRKMTVAYHGLALSSENLVPNLYVFFSFLFLFCCLLHYHIMFCDRLPLTYSLLPCPCTACQCGMYLLHCM
jgi:hypothetical protein